MWYRAKVLRSSSKVIIAFIREESEQSYHHPNNTKLKQPTDLQKQNHFEDRTKYLNEFQDLIGREKWREILLLTAKKTRRWYDSQVRVLYEVFNETSKFSSHICCSVTRYVMTEMDHSFPRKCIASLKLLLISPVTAQFQCQKSDLKTRNWHQSTSSTLGVE